MELKKCDLCDCDTNMAVGTRRAGLNILETVNLLMSQTEVFIDYTVKKSTSV